MISEKLGDVQFINFKTADNWLAGMEVALTDEVGLAKIVDGIVVGRSRGNHEASLDAASPHGIITPRSEGFTIDGTKFFNFELNSQPFGAALGTCSHCFHGASTDSGARTVTVRRLSFENVQHRIKYQYPRRAIFFDEDG
jgi:hypothetical protein